MPAFWFHYNKPQSKKENRNVLTIHYQGKCIMVYDIQIRGVDISTRHRKQQPRCVVAGVGIVTITKGRAVITRQVEPAKKATQSKKVTSAV